MISLLILVTQRRKDELADRRAQLTLRPALLAARRDPESESMAQPGDPQAAVAAIDARSAQAGTAEA